MWLTLLARFWYVIPLVLLTIAVDHYRHDAKDARNDLKVYQCQVEAAGQKARADAILKEKENAEKVSVAIASRNSALASLQSAQAAASAARRAMSRNITAPAGSNQVCFSSAAYNAAFQQFGAGLDRFIQSASGFAIEGDGAAIDASTLVRSWPSQQAVK